MSIPCNRDNILRDNLIIDVEIQLDTDADGTVHGHHRATGLRPRCLDEMLRRGIPYDTANFDPNKAL